MQYPRLLLTALVFVAVSTHAFAEVVILPSGAKTQWRYLDDGSTPDAAWSKGGFDDAAWKSGKSPLGYGEDELGTEISFGDDEKAKHITAYFRGAVNIAASDRKAVGKLRLRLRCDDGAVVYLNGHEIARINLPDGAVTSSTQAVRAVSGSAETRVHEIIVSAERLAKKGGDLVAVEVHQASATSSDLYMDLEIVGLGADEQSKPDVVEEKRDFYADGMAAARGRRYEEAAELLAQVDPSHPSYVQAMLILGLQVYGQALGKPRQGIPYVKKAYEAAPQNRQVVQAYLRAHVRSGVLFDDADIARERSKTVSEEHRFLVTKPEWDSPSEKISREKLEEDLNLLEHYLVKCFAYLKIRDVDYRAALDAIRLSLDDETQVQQFELQIAKLISLFGDGHARGSRRFMPKGYAPFVAAEYKNRIYLIDPSGPSLLDAEHPYVTHIDGEPIEKWIEVAGYTVVKESRQWHRRGALEILRNVNYVRAELGLPRNSKLSLRMESEDGEKQRELEVDVASRASRGSRAPGFPKGQSRRIEDVGYLRIPQMTSSPVFVAGLKSWMEKFKDTRGLIIDLRGNTGGSKTILWTLFPYFMPPDAPMRILELSVYRKPMEMPHPVLGGYMRSDTSGQPITSKRWTTDAQREQIRRFLAEYRTEWPLPEGEFSEWHVMALSAADNPDAYYYDKPLVILQNASSFSASDIFLGAFEDHPNTTLMGTPSGGGNGWQEGFTLPNSNVSVVLCLSAKFRPNGKLYDSVGIDPDVFMEATPQDVLGETDTVLDAAVLRLQSRRARI